MATPLHSDTPLLAAVVLLLFALPRSTKPLVWKAIRQILPEVVLECWSRLIVSESISMAVQASDIPAHHRERVPGVEAVGQYRYID